MKKFSFLLTAFSLSLLTFWACNNSGKEDEPVPEPEPVPNPAVVSELPFAYGCDPSWVTPMETSGIKFRNSDGTESECFSLLKSVGFNAARFRLWVNPKTSGSDGMCDIDDVLSKCKRAQAQDMKIMIDFHYSDSWADPAKQFKPKAWDNIETVDALAEQVYNYTKESLQKLRDSGIEVSWVQIGNETQTGMMKTQSDGSETSVNGEISKNNNNFAKMVTSGTKAVREIFPNAKTIVHLANGQDFGKLSWALDIMKNSGADYDIFGVSLYPYYNDDGWYTTYIDACISNLNKIADTYDKDVMICELGTSAIASWKGKRAVVNTVIRAKEEVPRCKGVFYWEPECYDDYNGYAMGGFLSDGSPAPALTVFAGKMTKEDLLSADDPDGVFAEDVLKICLLSGEEIGVLERQDDGTYRGTLNFSTDYANFTVTDKDGKTYGPKSSWDNQYSISAAHGDFNHFWIDGKAGKWTLVFDFSAMKWSVFN
jgi:arabinogalactan endo-1,4-beta-galactosidase